MEAIEGRNTRTDARAARRRVAARVVWAVAVAGLAGVVALAAAFVAAGATSPLDVVAGLAILTGLGAFILSGAVIISRQPGNVIGWLLMLPGLVLPASELTTRWLAALEPPPTTVTPGLWVLLWTTNASWLLLVFPIFHVLLTFPTGRLLSPRWRWAVALEAVLIATILVLGTVAEVKGPLVNDKEAWVVANPLGLVPVNFMDITGLGRIFAAGLLTITALSALAPVIRFRRGSADEREQLKWPLMGALVFGAIYGIGALQGGTVGASLGQALFGFGIAAIPISVAIAVTRYHLYEIDRIIGRTVAYGLITAVLASAFLVTNVALQSLLLPGTTFEVAVSTLVVAILFQPLRHSIQRPIDRRFDRARVDAERLVAGFAARTRDEIDLDRLVGETRRVAIGAVKPRTTGLWLRRAAR